MKKLGFRLILAGVFTIHYCSSFAAAPRVINVTPPTGSITALFDELTVTFDQAVSGVDPRDLVVNGSPASAVNGSGASYTFSFPQPGYGPVAVRFASDSAITAVTAVTDLFDTSPGLWTYTLRDSVPPKISQVHPPDGLTIRNLSQVEVTFNEPVAGVKATDLLVNGQPATSVKGVSSGPYVFQFPAVAPGTARVSWQGSQTITDLAAPANRFAGTDNWDYTINAGANGGDVVISEFLAGNTAGLKDEDGANQDWIELFNRGSTPARLLGWSLTDEADAPGRWTFPDVTIGVGQYLVVFASGFDRKPIVPGQPLHTNFKLSRAGEYLGLRNADAPRRVVSEFAPGYPEQRNNYSYGLDSGNLPRYFRTPSPGAPNGLSGISGVVAPPEFSVRRGFFNAFFFLTLSTPTPRATIRYTTDGSEPDESRGVIYSGPILIGDTRLVRAAAFKANTLPSEIVTHTYLFNLAPAVESLPALSIVTDANNLFGPTGIMEFKSNPPRPPNTTQHGIAWERPASVELIQPEDNGGFQVNAGLRVLGGDVVRELYNYNAAPPAGKYSFGLYFRSDYGAGSLAFPWFEQTSREAFDRIGLRAGFNDPINPFINDELVRRLMQDMGQVASHGTFVNLFLNGIYKGYYNPVERITPRFLQAWHGGSEDWDIIQQNEQVRDGTMDEWRSLRAFFGASDLSIPANYQEASRRLDLINFVDYLIINIYAGVGDWPFNNWRAARERVPGAKWRFYNWDSEVSFGHFYQARQVDYNEIANELALDTPIGNLFNKLRASPEFRLLFADRVQRHFHDKGALTEGNVLKRYDELRTQMLGVIPSMNNTIPKEWVPRRPAVIFSQMLNAGLLPSVSAPTLSPASGRVPRGAPLTLSAGNGQIYFTTDGTDPRVPFTDGIAVGAVAGTGQPILINRSTTISARVLAGGIWSALNRSDFTVEDLGIPLRISEIMYNPTGGDAYEFIELQNVGGTTVDLSEMAFRGIAFTFPETTTLDPGARLLLASGSDPAAFAARYPNAPVRGHFDGSLANGGERLTLEDRQGRTVTSVEYGDDNGWPLEADGLGASLEILAADGDPSDPASWRASIDSGGSPGTAPRNVAGGSVHLSEIMTRNVSSIQNGGSFPAWVELHNSGNTTAILNNWSLSNDSNPTKFVLPSGATIPPDGYLVLWCDQDFSAPGIHTGFFLTNQTASVYLYNEAKQRVDAVTVGLQLANQSVGRAGDQWLLNQPTPGGANNPAQLAPSTELVINEWLANANPGGDDFIELHNRNSFFPAALHGLGFSVNDAVFEFSSLGFIPPQGFVMLRADEIPGVDHLNFRLPAAGAKVVMYDATGAPIDQVEFGPQLEGVSQGRLPNGSSTIVSFPFSSTPGTANYSLAYAGPKLNEVMARNQSAVKDSMGRFPDWIELFNSTAAPVDISGMSLSADEPGRGQWKFPPGTVTPAGGFLVVWCDPLRPASMSFEAELNSGLRLHGEGGAIYLFDLRGQQAEQLEFGFQVANRSIGRAGSDWQLLASATPGAANSAPAPLGVSTALRLNEWLASPSVGDDWFEIYNGESLPVSLSGLYITDDPSRAGATQFQVGSLSFIGARDFVKFVADANRQRGPDHVPFNLDGQGETLRIYSATFQILDTVSFGVQPVGVSQGRLPDGSSADVLTSFPASASPGESNYLPLTDVVINEILANANPPFEQAVEIFNTSTQPVNIGGWYLSNDGRDLTKLRIPDGTMLPARSFKLFYETQFNAAPGNPGSFRLPAAGGGAIHVAAADRTGNLNGRQAVARFGAAENNQSIGRCLTSDGSDFVPLVAKTFGTDRPISVDHFRTGTGASNAPPRIGPIVISEIMYSPGEGSDDEFIELQNLTAERVLFFNPVQPENRWEIRGDIQFRPGSTLIFPPNGFLLLVGFDPVTDPDRLASFKTRYGVPAGVLVLGPISSRLPGFGALLELTRPETPSTIGPEAGVVPYIMVDRVAYRNRFPWPVDADGTSASLQRQKPDGFGNDPINWRAFPPTAGRANTIAPADHNADADGDGLPDSWEIANGLNPNNPNDALEDLDRDGYTNSSEYVAGTDPRNPASKLAFDAVSTDTGGIVLSFTASPGKSYSIQFTDDLAAGFWRTLEDVDATSGNVDVADNAGGLKRFYRLVAPKQ